MGVFGPRKRRISISKDDIKKSIKKANDKLKTQNKKIEDSIASANVNLKSVQSEIKQARNKFKDTTTKIDSRISECAAIDSQLLYLKDDLSSLTDKFKKELDIEKTLRSSVDGLISKESKLIKSIALLDGKKEVTKTVNAELKSAKQTYEQVKGDISQIMSEADKTKKEMKALKISQDIVEDEYDKVCEKLGKLKSQAKSEIKNLEVMLSEKKEYFESETTRLDQLIADRIEELSDNTELSNRKLQEYESILSRVVLAEKKIAQAEIQAKQVIDNQEIQIEKVKEKFKTWKLTQLDQVAKLKLKGKIANIDKAGLKDIFDV